MKKKKYVVGFNYVLCPSYDKVSIRGNNTTFYKGKKKVGRGLDHFYLAQNLGLEMTEAVSQEKAIKAVIKKMPFLVKEAIALEV